MMDAKVEKVARGSGFKGHGLLDPNWTLRSPRSDMACWLIDRYQNFYIGSTVISANVGEKPKILDQFGSGMLTRYFRDPQFPL